MTSNRFQITSVDESQPTETIPLINIETSSPPPPSSISSINETNNMSIRLLKNLLHRSKLSASGAKIESSSNPNSAANLTVEESDSCYSTVHSNTFDESNEFLKQIRLKRREIRDKAKDVPIDQRIAINRCRHDQPIIRAQDIFDVHFELNDNDNKQTNLNNEDIQEKIRNDIFHELDRQRIKQFHKQHRHLVLGRAFLMFITSFLIFMGITLIYVVINLIDQVKYFDTDPDFLPMNYSLAMNSESK